MTSKVEYFLKGTKHKNLWCGHVRFFRTFLVRIYHSMGEACWLRLKQCWHAVLSNNRVAFGRGKVSSTCQNFMRYRVRW